MSRHSFAFLTLLWLAACGTADRWAPVVDVANDPNAARLQTDIAECRELALQVGNNTTSIRSRSLEITDDGRFISGPAYHRAFSTCLTKRYHPVLNATN